MTGKSLATAAFVGAIVALVPWTVYEALLKLWPSIWEYDPVNVGPLSTALAFGQVLTAFFSLFLAGSVGWWAYLQYLDTQQRANLALSFEELGPSQSAVQDLEVDLTMGPLMKFSLWLENSGTIVSRWFAIHFSTELLSTGEIPSGQPQSLNIGPMATAGYTPMICYKHQYNYVIEHPDGSNVKVRVHSQGEIIAYPRECFELLEFHLPTDRFGPTGKTTELRYTIYTEKSKPVERSLFFHAT